MFSILSREAPFFPIRYRQPTGTDSGWLPGDNGRMVPMQYFITLFRPGSGDTLLYNRDIYR